MKPRPRLLALAGLALAVSAVPVSAALAAGGGKLQHMEVRLDDQAALQRGARVFRNYCLSCHSAAYMRYNRMGSDLGISEQVLATNFLFGEEKIGDTMTVSMDQDSAKRYFGGAVPPDLSVIARSRGADWLYTYLKSFYLDETRPFGVNNLVMPGVSMPHVLWELQGMQVPVHADGADGAAPITGLRLISPGTQNEQEYDRTVRDLVNFMVYMGEPVKLHRGRIGTWVMLYLLFFLAVAWFLKREYWRDVD